MKEKFLSKRTKTELRHMLAILNNMDKDSYKSESAQWLREILLNKEMSFKQLKELYSKTRK